MGQYLALVVTSSFFCTLILSMLSDKGAGAAAKTVVKLVMLAVIILPILSALINIGEYLAIPVINGREEHIIDNEDASLTTYRQWLADTTATQLSEEIERSLAEGLGIKAEISCPWHFEAGNVVFERICIYSDAPEEQLVRMQSYIKLHFSLDSVRASKEVE